MLPCSASPRATPGTASLQRPASRGFASARSDRLDRSVDPALPLARRSIMGTETVAPTASAAMKSDRPDSSARDDLLETLARHGRLFYRHGWTFATSGNLSAKADSGTAVITATGRHKGELGPGDFIECDLGDLGASNGAPTSSDSVIHRTVYAHVPEAGAVYHVHEPHAVAATVDVEGDRFEFSGFPVVKAFGVSDVEAGVEIPLFPDTGRARDLAEKLDAHLAALPEPPDVPGFAAERHGLYAWGESPFAARRHIEAMAHLFECKVLSSDGT